MKPIALPASSTGQGGACGGGSGRVPSRLGRMPAPGRREFGIRRTSIGRMVARRMLVTRFAPAPTGYLHLGHVLNAQYVWRAAREGGPDSRVLLRIEDHDRQRSRKEYEAAILEDLAWLGFAADGPVVRQRQRPGI